MTTRSAKLYQGEDKSPVYDYTDLVIWEESEFGTRAWQGEGSASSIVIRDPLGEQGNELLLPAGLSRKSLAAKNLFVVEVDSSTLFRGRVGIKNYSRDNQHVERYRQVECSLHDTNWDLDHIFVHQYSRPVETDKARVQGLIASYLSTSPRPTTALNGSNYISGSNLVTMPAQTYNRTSPLGMLREVAGTANKQFFVTGDAIGGGSLFYDGNDSTAYACTFTISDRESEVRAAPTTTFPPIWNVGPASVEDGSELTSHIRLFYGVDEDSYVTASSAIVQSQYSHASETITDDTVTDAANAQSKANARLAHRQYEDKNYNVTIGPLTDAQVVLVKHGMTINIKARAIPDADDQLRLMRIVQCRYTTPISGTWFAHLQLGRPWKMGPYGTGPVLIPQPPSSGSPAALQSITDFGGNQTPGALEIQVIAGTDHALYVALILNSSSAADIDANALTWRPVNLGDSQNEQAFTLMGQTGSGTPRMQLWRLLDPNVSESANSCVRLSMPNVGVWSVGAWYLNGVDQTTPNGAVATNTGTGTTSSLAITAAANTLVLNAAGAHVSGTIADPIPVAGQIEDFARNNATVFTANALGGGHGDATPGWTFDASENWHAVGVAVNSTTPSDTTQPVGATGSADTGDDLDHYSPLDHAHEHSNITTGGGPYHEAEDVSYAAGGTIVATTVQAAVTEAADEAVQKNILTTAGDVPYATAASTWTRRAIGASNFHLVTDGVSPLWAAQTAGGAAALIVQEDDVTVDAAAGTLDFTTALNVTSSPAGEANIAVDLGTGASQAAAGNHTHTSAESAKASGTGDVTTTASLADVTGATLSLAAGTYVVVGIFDTLVNNALNDRTFEGHLDVGGVDENDYAQLVAPGLVNVRATIPQSWRIVLASTTTVKLRTQHSGGTVGDFTVKSTNTTLTAYRAGGPGTLASARYVRTGATYTTSSTSFVDVDGTNLALTITTGARRVLIMLWGAVYMDNVAGGMAFDVMVDGVAQGGTFGLVYLQQHATTFEAMNPGFTYLTDTLSAGSHIFKLRWRVSDAAHTGALYGGAGGINSGFAVMEQGG